MELVLALRLTWPFLGRWPLLSGVGSRLEVLQTLHTRGFQAFSLRWELHRWFLLLRL